ncbi:MAG TPA: outer membrane beta-barrel protein [Candidatus Eisenbacteria bacterium]|nr:outer membrane beta-barrel protein [Candidatus Eisenbacteria bacterium]
MQTPIGFRFALRVVSALCAGVLFCSPATTVQAGPVAGDHEVEASAGFFHAQGSDIGSLNAEVHYGYYLSPGWQLGLRQALNYNFVEDATDQWAASTTPFLAYNFRLTDTVLPHLGAFIGAVWNDRDITGTLGPQVGIKFFFSPQTYIGLRYRYEWFFNKLERVEDNADNGNHVFNIGLGFVWGGSGPRK